MSDLRAERDRARDIAVKLEQQVARVRAFHAPFYWRVGRTSADDRRIEGQSDGADGSSSSLCSHCRVKWPCPTVEAMEADL